VAVAVQRAGTWSALCTVAGHEPDIWRRDTYCDQCIQGGAVLPDVPCNGHQRTSSHPGMEAAVLDRALFSDLETLAGDRGLSSTERAP